MTRTLTHRFSPMTLTRRQHRVVMVGSSREFSLRDESRLKRILNEKCDYVQNEAFEKPDAEHQLLDAAPQINRPDTSWYHPLMEKISNATGQFAGKNVGTVLLTAAQERTLFLQFNYCRYRVSHIRKQIGDQPVEPVLGRDLLYWYRRTDSYRDQIAQTNLALVLAMAKRTRMSDVDFADLVSEGNMALLRAVDKFDVARGFKFSTYACRAILKAFSRIGVTHSKYRQLFPTDFDPALEKSDYMHRKRLQHEEDCVDEVDLIVKENLADLTEIEQSVLTHRFALGLEKKKDPNSRPMTLEQVGKVIGVTKERVRQIQNKALAKIRQLLEEDFLG